MRVGHTGPPELYPGLIDLTERRVVVVGGGSVGARKLRALVALGSEEASEAMSPKPKTDSNGEDGWPPNLLWP